MKVVVLSRLFYKIDILHEVLKHISNSFNLIPFPNVNVATMCIKRKLQCTYTLRKFGMSGQINYLEKCFKIFAFYKTYVTSSSHIVCGFFRANAGSFTLI